MGDKMKMINEQGKLFGKIHIFDLFFLLLLIIVVLGAISKFSSGSIIQFTTNTKPVQVECVMKTEPYRDMYLESVQIGDMLAEDKKYLDGEITDIQIVDYEAAEIDNNGEMVVGTHPFKKQAIITIVATVDYKEPIYQMGKQEIREGAKVYLTTDTAKLSTIVISFDEIN